MLRLARYISTDGGINSSFKKKIALSFILVLVVLGIIFFAFRKNNGKAFETASLVEHTYEVLFEAEKVNTRINEMQSAARDCMISAEENCLSLFVLYFTLTNEYRSNRIYKPAIIFKTNIM